jgi:hypothetical protein
MVEPRPADRRNRRLVQLAQIDAVDFRSNRPGDGADVEGIRAYRARRSDKTITLPKFRSFKPLSRQLRYIVWIDRSAWHFIPSGIHLNLIFVEVTACISTNAITAGRSDPTVEQEN